MNIVQKITEEQIIQLRNDLLRSKKLFEDDSFTLRAPQHRIKWLRPHEICSNPQFIVEGVSRFDVNQGALGNCWFMAAIDNLTQHKQLFQRVVCDTNSSFTDGTYCGLFHFRFWYFGSWTNIIIDDRLPTRDGKLVFVQSKSQNEFWPALLEKAYAKLHGGYEILKGGHITEAFSNLTGGVTEVYDLKDPPQNFYGMVLKAFKRNTLMGASKYKESKNIGLPGGHAYAITHVTPVVDIYGNVTNLIRIRNPWGNEEEYTGDWSDYSIKWKNISIEEKQRIKWNAKGDGEFWMSFKDFLFHFDYLDICNLTPDMLTREPHSGRQWKVTTFQEVWTKNGKNQHEFSAVDPDPDDNEDYCTIVVAIMYISRNRKDINRLGLKITSPQDKKFIKVTKRDDYARRENVYRFDIMPGQYHFEVLSFDTQNNFEYLFRIFYETKKTDTIYPMLFDSRVLSSCNNLSKKGKKVNRINYYAQKKSGTKTCNIM
ncbi:hypothetical protein ACKWTF_008884 [Chironomus riparius]